MSMIERLLAHINALDELGAGNVERLSFDDLNAIHSTLEAQQAEIAELREALRRIGLPKDAERSLMPSEMRIIAKDALNHIQGDAK